MEDIQWRLMGKFVNEAAYCLQDEIVRGPQDGDIGAVFGVGFPPYLGGPFRMLDGPVFGGTKAFVDRMQGYRDKYGPQFEPAQILKDYAAANKKVPLINKESGETIIDECAVNAAFSTNSSNNSCTTNT